MFALPGTSELLIILIIVIILFGAGRLSSLGTSLGKTVNELRDIPRRVNEEIEVEAEPVEDDRPRAGSSTRTGGPRTSLDSLLGLFDVRSLVLRLVKMILFRR